MLVAWTLAGATWSAPRDTVSGASTSGALSVTVTTHSVPLLPPPVAATAVDTPTPDAPVEKPRLSAVTPDTALVNVAVTVCTKPATRVPFTPADELSVGTGGVYMNEYPDPPAPAPFNGLMAPDLSTKLPTLTATPVLGRSCTSTVNTNWVAGSEPPTGDTGGVADSPPVLSWKSPTATPLTGEVNVTVNCSTLAGTTPPLPVEALYDGTGGSYAIA